MLVTIAFTAPRFGVALLFSGGTPTVANSHLSYNQKDACKPWKYLATKQCPFIFLIQCVR